MRLSIAPIFLAIAAAVFGAASTSHAQVTTATLYGVVRDPSGSILPGATVTLTHEETGVTRTTLTNESGEFGATALPVGAYTVKIELQGAGSCETGSGTRERC